MNHGYKQIEVCRVCGNTCFEPVLDLGGQALTGVFPRSRSQIITSGPLRLVKCTGDNNCGLLQLEHTFNLSEMYGNNYGYRSGLNTSMSRHLQNKINSILSFYQPPKNSIVLDIGSNDGTTLAAYPDYYELIGIDPTASKFRQYYRPDITVVADFFSEKTFRDVAGNKQAAIVTSFSMFYDLENPQNFMQEISRILAPDGIWVFEQSYMPTMIKNNSYDTVCHEHLTYYGMKQIQWMLEKSGLKAVDIEFNDVNGGSFSVTAAKINSSFPESSNLAAVLKSERELGFDGTTPYKNFEERTVKNKSDMLKFLGNCKKDGKLVGALGASTKGNVFLQYCKLSGDDIVAIGEINDDKFGSFTPGTLIPIVPEHELMDLQPNYLLILPWHFKNIFIKTKRNANLVFAFPNLEVI